MSANANQAASFYGNLSFGQTAETFTSGRNRTPQSAGTRNSSRQGNTSRFNDLFNNPNRPAPTSLSDYNKMLNANPPSGQVTAVGAQRNSDFTPNHPNPRLAGIRFGAHRPPANTATLGSYINAGQNETRTPTSRATNRLISNTQLRADSPIFTSLHTPPEVTSRRPTSSSPAGGVALTGAFDAISRSNKANPSFGSDA